MLVSTLSFTMKLVISSLKTLGSVGQLLEYALPYRTMASNAIKHNINVNTPHLKKGDPLPPYNGKLRVYNMRYCPYAQRTILALNAKGIDYEVINVNLVSKPEWLPSKSPFGKVPAIEVKEGLSIYESLITVEYLDDVYPQRPLIPKDPVKKAFDKIIIENSGFIHTLLYRAITNPDAITEENVTAYHRGLDFIQEQLRTRGTKFLDGSEPGYADYMIWPWFERVLIARDIDERLKIDATKYKLLSDYIEAMLQDPAVKEYLVPKDIMLKFWSGYSQKPPNPDYELLTEH